MDSDRLEVTRMAVAFIDEFQAAVASHVPALRASQEALEEFLEEWADTLLDRVQACKSVGGNPYGLLVVLLNELLKNQIDVSLRARWARPTN